MVVLSLCGAASMNQNIREAVYGWINLGLGPMRASVSGRAQYPTRIATLMIDTMESRKTIS